MRSCPRVSRFLATRRKKGGYSNGRIISKAINEDGSCCPTDCYPITGICNLFIDNVYIVTSSKTLPLRLAIPLNSLDQLLLYYYAVLLPILAFLDMAFYVYQPCKVTQIHLLKKQVFVRAINNYLVQLSFLLFQKLQYV